MQITCDFGPCAAVKYPYVSVEVGHCVKAEKPSRVGEERPMSVARDLSFGASMPRGLCLNFHLLAFLGHKLVDTDKHRTEQVGCCSLWRTE
jgi:hypothetical protein